MFDFPNERFKCSKCGATDLTSEEAYNLHMGRCHRPFCRAGSKELNSVTGKPYRCICAMYRESAVPGSESQHDDEAQK
jgi:hypothetical protein